MMTKQDTTESRPSADTYSYEVRWSEEDNVFVAKAEEWDFVSAHGETQSEALQEAKNAVELALEECDKDNIEPPEPYSRRQFSGTFSVRIPPSLHRELTQEADKQGVSLNQLVTTKLARG